MRIAALSPLMQAPVVAVTDQASTDSLLPTTSQQPSFTLAYQRESTPAHSSTSCSRSQSEMSESDAESNENGHDLLESVVFSSLYGYQAIPIRVKILVHRAISAFSEQKALSLIQRAGWTREDLHRGFIDEDPKSGKLLTSWSCASIQCELQQMDRFVSVPSCSGLVDSLRTSLMPSVLHNWPSAVGVNPPLMSLHQNACDTPRLPRSPASESTSGCEASANGDLSVDLTKDGDDSTRDECNDDQDQPLTIDDGSVKFDSTTASIESKSKSGKNTGKRRVQCVKCLKTFCDKGALKIHNSAVHLKEMHKCTVEGCEMMFSSRRSRNRHSANPNPKLHTATPQRPFDGFPGDAVHENFVIAKPESGSMAGAGSSEVSAVSTRASQSPTISEHSSANVIPPSSVPSDKLSANGSGTRKRKSERPIKLSVESQSKSAKESTEIVQQNGDSSKPLDLTNGKLEVKPVTTTFSIDRTAVPVGIFAPTVAPPVSNATAFNPSLSEMVRLLQHAQMSMGNGAPALHGHLPNFNLFQLIQDQHNASR